MLSFPGPVGPKRTEPLLTPERKVQRVRKAVDPPEGAIPDWKVICELGTRLGVSMDYESPGAIYDEIASLSPAFAGINYARLEAGGIQWPCPSPDHKGTPFLHEGRFTRGRGLFHVIDFRPPEELPDDDFPFLLTTGRRYAHYHTRTMTREMPVSS